MNPWKLVPPTSSTTKSFEIFSSHEKTLGKPWLSEFRTNEKDCYYFGYWTEFTLYLHKSLDSSIQQIKIVRYWKKRYLKDHRFRF